MYGEFRKARRQLCVEIWEDQSCLYFVHIDGTLFCPRHEPTLDSEIAVSLPVVLCLVFDSSENTWTPPLFVVRQEKHIRKLLFFLFQRCWESPTPLLVALLFYHLHDFDY